MNFIRYAVRLIFTVAIALGSSFVMADTVTLIPEGSYATGANINALAGPLFSSDFDSVDIAGSGADMASAAKDGNFATHVNTVELDFSGGGVAFFDSVYESPFSRTAILDHRASAESIFHFSVDVPTFYDVGGIFSVIDDFGTTVAGNVELEIELLEFDSFGLPSTGTVFYSYQMSKSTIDQGFIVGGLDGDDTNSLIGLSSGILDPTKLYRYRTLVTTNAIDIDGGGIMPPTDGGAMATGGHTIMFAAVTVPEPTSVCLLSVLCLAAVCRRRRRKLSCDE